MFFAERDEIIVITADRAGGLADAMKFQRLQSLWITREELRLHFLCDRKFAFEALLFLLFPEQTLEGFRHGIERSLE